MDVSLFLAKVLGVWFLVSGLSLLLNRKYWKKFTDEFVKSPAIMFLGGTLAFVLGYLMVTFHNVWEGGWPVLVTVIAWITLLKGLYYLLFPDAASKFIKSMKVDNWITPGWVFAIIIGLYLCYVGFYMA